MKTRNFRSRERRIKKRRNFKTNQKLKKASQIITQDHVENLQITKNLIPITVLSNEQMKVYRNHALILEVIKVTKNTTENCNDVVYNIVEKGARFTEESFSIIVVTKESLRTSKLNLGNPFQHMLFVMTGDVTGDYVLVAYWNVDATFMQEFKIDDNFVDRLRMYKPNINSTNTKHHASVGYAYGYGIKASFKALKDNAHKISFAEYATKKNKYLDISQVEKEDKYQLQSLINQTGQCLESCAGKYNAKGPCLLRSGTCIIKETMLRFQYHIPELTTIAQPLSEYGFYAAYYNFNFETKNRHTENDSSYTLIGVPKQQWIQEGENSPTTFNFCIRGINDADPIRIPLKVGTSIIFHGGLIVHHQVRNKQKNLMNVSAYGNKRLFSNIRRSIRRNVGIVNMVSLELGAKFRNRNILR